VELHGLSGSSYRHSSLISNYADTVLEEFSCTTTIPIAVGEDQIIKAYLNDINEFEGFIAKDVAGDGIYEDTIWYSELTGTGSEVVYYATADGYKYSSASPCITVDDDMIKIGYTTEGYHYEGLLCFNGIDPLTSVSSATLRLYIYEFISGGGYITITTKDWFDSYFEEPLPTCSWFDLHGEDIGAYYMYFGDIIAGTWMDIDITDEVIERITEGHIGLSLDVVGSGGNIVTFHDHENSRRPELVINSGAMNITHKSLPDIFNLIVKPNPFNSSVSISSPVDATVEIYDVLGKSMDKLPGGEQVWQPEASVGSGVYLVRAKVGDKDITKRVVYLK